VLGTLRRVAGAEFYLRYPTTERLGDFPWRLLTKSFWFSNLNNRVQEAIEARFEGFKHQ
jgi:hypothetical protein